MRRKIRRSLRTSSPVHRRVFRPAAGWLEPRTLLSSSPTYYTVNLTSDTGASSGTDATTGDPSGDLLWAIEQANANTNPCGSVINFDWTVFATSQTITLSSTLELSESPGPELFDATGIAGTVIISGNNQVGVFQLDGGVTATLNGLTITGGSAVAGGGIVTEDFATVTLSNSTLADNTASFGGALYNSFRATVINSVFLDNTVGNNAQGGAIYNADMLSVSGSTFTGNSANGIGQGAGGALLNNGVATLSSDAFSNNTAYQGGALSNDGGGSSLSLSGSTLSDNTTTGGWGGGIWNQGTLTITTSTITGNTAANDGASGGGIYNQGSLALTASTLAGNSAVGAGGLVNAGSAVVEDSTLSGNSTPNSGGAIWTYGTMTIVNSTIADNQAGGVGGGIFYSGGSLTVVTSTVAYNITGSGRGGGGIYAQGGAPVTLDNTIVAENDLNGDGDDLSAGYFTGSNNLVGYDATGTLSSNDKLLGVANAGIGLLANNGGPTETIALLAGSPAIGAGSVALAVDPTIGQRLAYDQRGIGYPRIVAGAVDIGAYEGPDATTTSVSTSLTPSVYGQPVTLTATVVPTPPLSGTAITPTGAVTFYDGTTPLGMGTLNSHGVASYTTSALQLNAGSNQPVTALYGGDTNYNTSTSNVLRQTVSKDSTTTAVTAVPAAANIGQTVTFTAIVTANAPGSGTPTGTVDFFDTSTNTDLTPTGVAVSSTGTAIFATTGLAPGNHTIKASYSGDGNFLASNASTSPVTIGPFVIVLDPSAGGALSLSGNASINISGNVYVDSNASSALSASGNAQIKASLIDVHGKVQKSGNASLSTTPVTGAAVFADPFAGLAAPVASTLGLTSKGSLSLSGNATQTIGPGVYSQISLSGNASLTLNPGVYIITGGGFTASGKASVSVSGPSSAITGTGVMIYNAGSGYNVATGADGGSFGATTLSGNGAIKLAPPTTGADAGILIFQARDNPKALTFSGNALQGVTGVIYAPAAQLAESGNGQIGSTSNPISIIVDTLSASGNAIADGLTLTAPGGSVAYSPAQIRSAYGVNNLALDGTGQTIAIVDAYDDPSIFQSVDAFDSQFGLTATGSTLYEQYGPASSFLTVLNQYGQATSLPSTDPNGAGTDNWEVEEALDVEWAHAIVPGAQLVLVEANSQSFSDLMTAVGTAAHQPGVSVVSMSWGFPEGQAVFAADEAAYDSVFNVPGVTFVASTGDYGASDSEYPAFSSNVVAVGGTSLTLNADNSYNSETGWGYYSNAVGASKGSGGGISLYETEPAYQLGVQSLGMRTTPDVSLVADPATGAWIADTYNLDPSNPFEVVGGTSLSAPAWAGLLALVDQGRAAAGESALNTASPIEVQQALYSLPQSDYNVITSGSNGYNAGAGYNLVTGLGTPVANLLVPDLVAYQGPGTVYGGATVGPLQDPSLSANWAGSGGPNDVFSVFDSLTVTSAGLNHAGENGARRQQTAVGDLTISATGGAERSLVDLAGAPGVIRSSTAARPAQPLPPPASALGSAVDQVLDADPHDTLIGDLAFEQASSGTHKPRGRAAVGPTS